MVSLRESLLEGKTRLAVVGLGYVGLPIALAFAKRGVKVIGFDINESKVGALKDGIDITLETTKQDLLAASGNIHYTSDPADLRQARFIIVAVPTPIDENKTPDLKPLEQASLLLGANLSKEAVAVYESTVYPGVTEDICVPLLEKASGLSWKAGDFFVGYSPERINPGDKEHTLEKIVKVVSGQDARTCDQIAGVYEIVIKAGVYKAESIKVAEAAKVIENTQRDLNIALMNELALIFDKIGISTEAVLKAAGTKWNFLKFHPGLVGGHCIGVDPYYLTSKSEQLGYHPQVVLAGRRINDSMGTYIAQQAVKQMIKSHKIIEGANVLVLGLTFKENVPDFRNSRVVDIIRELKTYGVRVCAYDPFAAELDEEYRHLGIRQIRLEEASEIDTIILATPHDELRSIPLDRYFGFCRKNNGKPVFVDVRWVFNRAAAEEAGFHYWRL